MGAIRDPESPGDVLEHSICMEILEALGCQLELEVGHPALKLEANLEATAGHRFSAQPT
jgi:hypothetical protein